MAATIQALPHPARSQYTVRHTPTSMINICRESHSSPLLRVAAATWNREQPAELRAMLQNGIEPHETDIQDNTCLHLLLANVHPNQYWAVHSVTTLLRAGADPRQSNSSGRTAFDVACNAPPTLGSFRRDLLLQALLESGKEVSDDRLFNPTRLTDVYNELRHEAIFGARSNSIDFEMQASLQEQFTKAVEDRNLSCNRDLPKAALRRAMELYEDSDHANPDKIVETALEYLERMCEGKKHIIRMCSERVHKHTAMSLGKDINLLQIRERANAEALLEYDWFRPVDVDDLFSSYVEIMMDQLNALRPATGPAENIDALIGMMQSLIPSYDESAQLEQPSPGSEDTERTDGGRNLLPLNTKLDKVNVSKDIREEPLTSGSSASQVERKASIAETPVRFYRPEF